jgi:hypothetical protein
LWDCLAFRYRADGGLPGIVSRSFHGLRVLTSIINNRFL